MKLKSLAILSLLLVCVLVYVAPAFAQGGAADTVSFNKFSFKLDPTFTPNVNIVQFPGDPKDAQQPGGPEVRHTEFLLYKELPVPSAYYDASAVIGIYNVADFSGYEMAQQQLDQLKQLLDTRPDLKPYSEVHQDMNQDKALPFMPIANAAQVIRAHVQYVDTAQVKGISYITVYRQDVSPYTADEFIYTFQGFSTDGQYYVSARVRLTTTLFPKDYPANFDYNKFAESYTQYNIESVAKLNNATPTDFTPPLAMLDSMVQSFAFTK